MRSVDQFVEAHCPYKSHGREIIIFFAVFPPPRTAIILDPDCFEMLRLFLARGSGILALVQIQVLPTPLEEERPRRRRCCASSWPDDIPGLPGGFLADILSFDADLLVQPVVLPHLVRNASAALAQIPCHAMTWSPSHWLCRELCVLRLSRGRSALCVRWR